MNKAWRESNKARENWMKLETLSSITEKEEPLDTNKGKDEEEGQEPAEPKPLRLETAEDLGPRTPLKA